jgi:hypothetical protein
MDIEAPHSTLQSNGFYRYSNPPVGQVGVLCYGSNELALIYEREMRTVVLDDDTSLLPLTGPLTVTLELRGPKVPFEMIATVNDTSGGYPGTDTDTNYPMGNSNPSQDIELGSHGSLTKLTIMRRF